MNLAFMKQFPWGTETNFDRKVLSGLLHDPRFKQEHQAWIYENIDILPTLIQRSIYLATPKLHTIRQGNRWRPGMKIHFRQWSGVPRRSKCPLFAPVYRCVGHQKIEINYFKHQDHHSESIVEGVEIYIDERLYATFENAQSVKTSADIMKLEILAKNDGFDYAQDFFTYFANDFKGQITHWTDLKY